MTEMTEKIRDTEATEATEAVEPEALPQEAMPDDIKGCVGATGGGDDAKLV